MIWTKRITSAVTSAAIAVSAMCMTVPFVNVEDASAALTSQNAQEITSQMTIGWNLGNTLDATAPSGTPSTASPKKFSTAWGMPEPTEELIETVDNAGFNTIRIPTTWYQHLEYDEATDTYVINEKWMAYVKQVVDWAYERDMFIILNIHHEEFINVAEFTDETLAVAQKKLGDIWKQVSKEFENYDQHLIFEGMNEPRQTGNSSVSEWGNGSEDGGYTWKYINTLNKTFIDIIRSEGSAENSERLLMIPAYVATTDAQALNAVEIPENAGNIAISTHAYSPYFFTMATDDYANHEFPGKSGYGEDYEQSLENLFSSLKQFSQSKNVPIIMGEFSASDFNNTESRINWAKKYISCANDAGIPCVLWDNGVIYEEGAKPSGENHGYIYRATNTIFPNSAPVLSAMMDTLGVTDYVLPDYKAYEKPAFSWDAVGIEDNWVEIYRNDEGKTIDAWKNFTVDNWKDYANDKYMFAFVYDSDDKAEIVFMNSAGGENWNRIAANDDKSKQFVAYFTYEDITSQIIGGGTIDDMDCLFLSATMKPLTAYGLYAVPVAGEVENEIVKGDINGDGKVDCIDLLSVKKYILGVAAELTADAQKSADMNEDGSINIIDVIMIKNIILKIA